MAVDPDKVLRAQCAGRAVDAIKQVGGYPYPTLVAKIAACLYRSVHATSEVSLDLEAQFAVLADQIASGEQRPDYSGLSGFKK